MSQESTRPLQPRRVDPTPIAEPQAARPRHTPEVVSLSEGEATPETLHAYLDHLAESSRRFNDALGHYHELLQAQDKTETTLLTLEEQYQNEQRFAQLKAKATKLAWAVTRYITSSTIVGTGAGAAGYIMTGDLGTVPLAAAGGALAGTAIELALSRAEEANDLSDKFFELYEPTQAYMQDKKRRTDSPASRETEMASLMGKLTILQDEITRLGSEIDTLAAAGNTSFNDPRAPKPIEGQTQQEAEVAIQALVEHLRTAGGKLNELLIQYSEMSVVADSAEEYLSMRQQAYDNRELSIKMRVTARKIWEMIKVAHMTVGTGGIMAMAGLFYNSSQTGEQNIPMATLGGAVGAAIGWFQISRLEKKVWNNNIPVGQYEIRDKLAVREDYQLATDYELQRHGSLLDQAKADRQRLQAEQDRLNSELEAFMSKYPMGTK